MEAPGHPRNKFCRLAGGARSSPLDPGAGVGLPPGTPQNSGSSGVQHRRASWERKSRLPRKRSKILDSSEHLLARAAPAVRIPPRSALQGRTRLPAGSAPRGRGRRGGACSGAGSAAGAGPVVGRGLRAGAGPARGAVASARGWDVHAVAWALGAARLGGRAQSRLHRDQPQPNPDARLPGAVGNAGEPKLCGPWGGGGPDGRVGASGGIERVTSPGPVWTPEGFWASSPLPGIPRPMTGLWGPRESSSLHRPSAAARGSGLGARRTPTLNSVGPVSGGLQKLNRAQAKGGAREAESMGEGGAGVGTVQARPGVGASEGEEEPSANLLVQKEMRFGGRLGSGEVSTVVVGSLPPPTRIEHPNPHCLSVRHPRGHHPGEHHPRAHYPRWHHPPWAPPPRAPPPCAPPPRAPPPWAPPPWALPCGHHPHGHYPLPG